MPFYIALALVIIALLWLFYRAAAKIARAFVFLPTKAVEKTPENCDLPFEEVHFPSKDDVLLHGWFIPHEEAVATVLFFHGNAGNVSHRLDELTLWHYIKVSVFIVDYRGYGKSRGTPSEHGIYMDAEAAYDYLIHEKGIAADKIVCFGRSLGGAVAINLALRKDCGALILSSTFTSARDMVDVLFPRWLAPICAHFLPVRMRSLELVSNLMCPLLIVHGQYDAIVPCPMGKALYDKAPNPKMWYAVPEAGHNDVFVKGGKKYWYLLNAFIVKTFQKGEVDGLKL